MVGGQTIAGEEEVSRKDDRLSASAKPFRPSALVVDGVEEGDEIGSQYRTPRSSVMKSSLNGFSSHDMPPHAQFGQKTRMLLEGLDQVPFTPSQGVCTPSPNNMATALLIEHHHHHHHVVCQNGLGASSVNDAFLAGVAAGRAAAQSQSYRRDVSQPPAMCEGRDVNNNLIQAVYQGNRPMLRKDMVSSPAGAPSRLSSGQQTPSKNNTSTFEKKLRKETKSSVEDRDVRTDLCDVRGKGEPSKSDKNIPRSNLGRSIDMDKARSLALHISSVEGVRGIGNEIPQELIDLATLLISLEIPTDMATCPASQFCSPKKGPRTEKFSQGMIKLNARQRRTLRRAQERAWKVLDELREADRQLPQHGHAGYILSPSSERNPQTTFSDYSCMVMHPIHMISVPSPTQVAGFYPNSLMSSPHEKMAMYHQPMQNTRPQ